uniref:Uncharacterized protein n=1 Tax=Oryza glumipatula TaxID=40148 RepID=A0A0E0BCZ4_9ORYZ
MTSDSEMGLPPWMSTGTFLCTGLEVRRSSLLLKMSSSTIGHPFWAFLCRHKLKTTGRSMKELQQA